MAGLYPREKCERNRITKEAETMTRLLGHLLRLIREGLAARASAIGTQHPDSTLFNGGTQTRPENRQTMIYAQAGAAYLCNSNGNSHDAC